MQLLRSQTGKKSKYPRHNEVLHNPRTATEMDGTLHTDL